MADDDKKKEESKPAGVSAWEIAAVILLLILVSNWIAKINGSGLANTSLNVVGDFFVDYVAEPLVLYIIFANILSVVLLLGIIYAAIRTHQVEAEWKETFYPRQEEVGPLAAKNPRWQTVEGHINSDNPSEWRLAILEADIVLDELLDTLGYFGDTMGEKLKGADTGKFRTLNNAWEAHKIRNAIAHEGADFTLTKREARRIIDLYESVFREFNFI